MFAPVLSPVAGGGGVRRSNDVTARPARIRSADSATDVALSRTPFGNFAPDRARDFKKRDKAPKDKHFQPTIEQ
jgi:hypothetical protein